VSSACCSAGTWSDALVWIKEQKAVAGALLSRRYNCDHDDACVVYDRVTIARHDVLSVLHWLEQHRVLSGQWLVLHVFNLLSLHGPGTNGSEV
jgi:hypothetical protein